MQKKPGLEKTKQVKKLKPKAMPIYSGQKVKKSFFSKFLFVFIVFASVVALLALIINLPIWKSKLKLNADILPANRESNALYVHESPDFNIDFGDKDRLNDYVWSWKKTNTESKVLIGGEKMLISSTFDEQKLSPMNTGNLNEDEELLRLIASDFDDNVSTSASQEQNQLDVVLENKAEAPQGMKVVRKGAMDAVYVKNAEPEVDILTSILSGRGVREEITVNNLQKNKFTFLLNLDPGVKMNWSPTSINGDYQGTYYFTDESDNYLWHLSALTVLDMSGEMGKATFSIKPVEDITQSPDSPSLFLMDILVDSQWSLSPNRQRPMTITQDWLIDQSAGFVAAEIDGLKFTENGTLVLN